jgi:hypothetical protein
MADQIKIINRKGWAKSFAPRAGQTTTYSSVIINKKDDHLFDLWAAEDYKDSQTVFTLQNVGSKFWLSAHGGQVVADPKFKGKASTWTLKHVSGEDYRLMAAGQNLAVTVSEGNPPTLLLQNPKAGSSQMFQIFNAEGA